MASNRDYGTACSAYVDCQEGIEEEEEGGGGGKQDASSDIAVGQANANAEPYVGARIEVLFDVDGQQDWYGGKIIRKDKKDGIWLVLFDDGDEDSIIFPDPKGEVRIVSSEKKRNTAQANKEDTEDKTGTVEKGRNRLANSSDDEEESDEEKGERRAGKITRSDDTGESDEDKEKEGGESSKKGEKCILASSDEEDNEQEQDGVRSALTLEEEEEEAAEEWEEEEEAEEEEGEEENEEEEEEEEQEEQEKEKVDHLLVNQVTPSAPVSKSPSDLRPGRLSPPEQAGSEGTAQASKPPQGDLDVQEQGEQPVVLDRNALKRKQLRETVRADAFQKRNQEAAARKAAAEQLRLQEAAAVIEEAEDQEIQDFVEECKLSVVGVVKLPAGESGAALAAASKKPGANTRAKGRNTNGQPTLQFTITKLVPRTQHWIVGTDTEDDDDVSAGKWSNFQLAPNGGLQTGDNTVTPFVFFLQMSDSFKMFKRYAILADTDPAIKKNANGFLSSEMYARMSDPTDVLDRTKIMSTMRAAGTEEKEDGIVVNSEKEEEAMILEPDQMLQAKIPKEDPEAAKWNTISWHFKRCKSDNDDVYNGALYIPFLLTLCDEVRGEKTPRNPRRLCRGWHYLYKGCWDIAMKLYLQHKHNDAKLNELWDKEVEEMSIMQIKKPNDCVRAAGILAAYPDGKMALETLMKQVRKDFQLSPTPKAHLANLANPMMVINIDDDQDPHVDSTSEAPKRYVDDEECKVRLEDGNEPRRLKRDRSKWELEEESDASTDLDRQRIENFGGLGIEKLKQCAIAAEGQESGIQHGIFKDQAQKNDYIVRFKYLLKSNVMTKVKHFPTYDTHNTNRPSIRGPNTYAGVSKRLQDGGEDASHAYDLSHTLRWVAQELAGGAQSFKDFNLNEFIADLVKNPCDADLFSGSPDSNDLDDLAIEDTEDEAGRAQGSLKRKSCPSPPTVQKHKSQTPFGQKHFGISTRRDNDVWR